MFSMLVLSLSLGGGDGPVRSAIRDLKPTAPPPAKTINNSLAMLTELEKSAKTGIPSHLLAKAEAVILIPDTIKVGFIMAGRGGHGVVLTRDDKGEWGTPSFVNLGGVSFGPQLGVQATDVVLLIKSKKTVENLLNGKNKLTLGVDAAIAAGPIGRKAEAATDGQFKAEILSYSKTRGLFAGVSLSGGYLYSADESNREFAKDTTVEMAESLKKLKTQLHEMAK